MQIWIGWIKPYHLLTVNNTVHVVAPCKRNLLLFSRVRRRKGTSVWILSSFRRRRRPNIGLVNLVFQCYECEHRFVNKPMVIAEPTVPSARLLGLGSRLYPSNMPRMPNKDRTRFNLEGPESSKWMQGAALRAMLFTLSFFFSGRNDQRTGIHEIWTR